MIQIRHIYLLLIVITALFIISCGNDDSATLVGGIPSDVPGDMEQDKPDKPVHALPAEWTKVSTQDIDPRFLYMDLAPGCMSAPTEDGRVTDGIIT